MTKETHLQEIKDVITYFYGNKKYQKNYLTKFFTLIGYKNPAQSAYQYKRTKMISKKLLLKLEYINKFIND